MAVGHGPVVLLVVSTLVAVQPPARTPDVHFTPTRHAIADAMLQLAGVGPRDIVYDLGSGDGRIPIIAAQKYGALGIGIEIDPGWSPLRGRTPSMRRSQIASGSSSVTCSRPI